MSSPHLTNSERFKKYRFGKASSHQSDSQIVCHGTLVTSHRAPDRFYNGWYPIRNCPHRPRLAAGVRSSKDTSFHHCTFSFPSLVFIPLARNYHVICDICDAPRNKEKGRRKKRDRIDCSSRSLLSCSSSTKPLPPMANAHWRQHDPHMWMDRPQICSNARVHKTNWFFEDIKLGMRENERRRLQRLPEKEKNQGRVCHPKERQPVSPIRISVTNSTTPTQGNSGGSHDKMEPPKEERQTE